MCGFYWTWSPWHCNGHCMTNSFSSQDLFLSFSFSSVMKFYLLVFVIIVVAVVQETRSCKRYLTRNEIAGTFMVKIEFPISSCPIFWRYTKSLRGPWIKTDSWLCALCFGKIFTFSGYLIRCQLCYKIWYLYFVNEQCENHLEN